MIVAALLSWVLTVPTSAVIAVAILWYWVALDKPDVPASRRRIRRASMIVLLVSLPVFVRALSFISHQSNPSQFVIIWSMLLLLLLLLVITAIADVVNTMKIHQEQQLQEMAKAAADMLAKAREDDQ
ncbi:MAG: hypothetical protein IH984_00985 [Planctomycetes bacterium]|nr:hypothetical protein [Planctomycetota bacterium]